MGAVRAIAVAAVLFPATAVHANTIDRWHVFVSEASTRFGVPTSWIERVIGAESAGMSALDGHPIRSKAGAIGLMQLMPATWRAMQKRLALGDHPDDPRANILAGTLFLRLLYGQFGYPGLFAAYNAGPSRYYAFLARGRRLPAETVAYLAQVSGSPAMRSLSAIAPPAQILFAVQKDGRFGLASTPFSRPAKASLFVIDGAQP